jgi:KaiC/GvpD/RAD55 family RecA-like ATPase
MLDLLFVAAIVRDGRDAVFEAIKRGVTVDYLSGEGAIAYQFVLDYVKQFPDAPGAVAVAGSTNITLPPPLPETSDYIIEEIRKRRLHDELGKSLNAIVSHREQRHPLEAYQEFEEQVRRLRLMNLGGTRTVPMISLADPFLQHYADLKAGKTGILTPWPSVNDATVGLWPEDLVLYVARLAVGKTWILIVMANHAWVNGHRVLFVTTEMSQIQIMQRWVGVHFKLPYNDLRKGRLGVFPEQVMRDGLTKLSSDDRLRIIGGEFDFRIESIEAAIEECQPEVVFIDGAYLLKTPGEGRIERAAAVFDELKRSAKRNHLPVVTSTQFNRQMKVNNANTASADKIALTDNAGWNASLVYGLIRTEDMVRDRRIIHRPIKFREGEGRDVECWFDFDRMCFDELPQGPAGAGAGVGPAGGGPVGGGGAPDDDPYGTGLLFSKGDADGKNGPDVPF